MQFVLVLVQCDLMRWPMLKLQLAGPGPAVILIKLCLEFAIASPDELPDALTRLARLLRPGGLLVILGALGEVESDFIWMICGTLFRHFTWLAKRGFPLSRWTGLDWRRPASGRGWRWWSGRSGPASPTRPARCRDSPVRLCLCKAGRGCWILFRSG